MSINASFAGVLTLQSLDLSEAHIYPAFLFGTLAYLFILFCNLLILITVFLNRNLHKPMFILLCNLPISDMVGATAFFPQLVHSIVTRNRMISHPACVTQALLIHVYGTGNLLTLSAMAYDRYIAICCPLRYNAIMSPQTILGLTVFIWIFSFLIMGILILLLARFQICRTEVVDLFCNNPALKKLVCEDTSVNNYYGMFFICVIQGGSLSIIMYTYAQILRTCLRTNQSDARQKAIQTCGTHLTVYLVLQFNTLVALISQYFESVSPFLRRTLGVSILIFPPILDPIIYGLKTTELKQNLKMLLRRKWVFNKAVTRF